MGDPANRPATSDPEAERRLVAELDDLGARLRETTATAAHEPRIRQLAATARDAGPTAPLFRLRPLPGTPRDRIVASVAALVLGIPFGAAGLAVAGVALPGPAVSAFEALGIELPNQTDDASEQTDDAGEPRSDSPRTADERDSNRSDPAASGAGDDPSAKRVAGEAGAAVGDQGKPPAASDAGSSAGGHSPGSAGGGRPDGAPSSVAGPPEDAPDGPPAQTPSAPPAGTPGAPSDVPQAAPAPGADTESGGEAPAGVDAVADR